MMVVLVVTVVLGGVKRVLLVLLCVVLEENYERSAIKFFKIFVLFSFTKTTKVAVVKVSV